MKKSTLLFEATLEIYLVARSNGILRYHLVHSQPSRSFVKQWVQAIKALWAATTEANTKDTGGSLRTHGSTIMRINGPIAQQTPGIIVGTGTNAVAIDDYKLQTPIAHGSGAGQLMIAAQIFDAFSVVGSTAKFRTKRQFDNQSGAPITVNEAGIYHYDNNPFTFCTLRDIITPGYTLGIAQIAEFRYTFKATV